MAKAREVKDSTTKKTPKAKAKKPAPAPIQERVFQQFSVFNGRNFEVRFTEMDIATFKQAIQARQVVATADSFTKLISQGDYVEYINLLSYSKIMWQKTVNHVIETKEQKAAKEPTVSFNPAVIESEA